MLHVINLRHAAWCALLALTVLPACAAAPAQHLTNDAVRNYEAGRRSKALIEFKQAAELGNRLAEFDYAMMLLNGEGGIPPSPDEAVLWLRKAADAGMAQAQYTYGKMFDDGYILTKSVKDANLWYGRAAEQGQVQAQAALANAYFIGRGFPRDYRTAFGWYQKAAEGGDLPSQYIVASYYERGYGVITPDLDQARVWYARAAAQGDVVALGKLRELNRRRAEEQRRELAAPQGASPSPAQGK